MRRQKNKLLIALVLRLSTAFVTDMLGIGSDPKVLQTMTGHQDLDTVLSKNSYVSRIVRLL